MIPPRPLWAPVSLNVSRRLRCGCMYCWTVLLARQRAVAMLQPNHVWRQQPHCFVHNASRMLWVLGPPCLLRCLSTLP